MGLRTIGILLHREFVDLVKNKTLIIISILGLCLFLTLYFLIPAGVDDDSFLAIYCESDNTVLNEFLTEKEISYQLYKNYEEFSQALNDNEFPAGLVFTDVLWNDLQKAEEVEIPFIISPSTAEEYVDVLQAYLEIFLNELVLKLNENSIPLSVEDITVGADSLVDEVPLNKLFIPLIIIMIFVTEMLGFGNSLMEEIESRTITAILAAPVHLSDFLFSKSFLGVSIITFQSVIVLIVTGAINSQIIAVLFLILFSALLISGLSFFLAAISKDLMTLVSWGLLFMMIIIVPVSGVLFPGLHSIWMNFIPTYILADSLNKLINLQLRWTDVITSMSIIAISSLFFFYLGLFFLRRRIRCL